MSFDREGAIVALQRLGFKAAGSIELPVGSDVPLFNLDQQFTGKGESRKAIGWVYLWAKYASGSLTDVCYVGKAGKTLKARCDQHVGGFKGSTKKGEINGQHVRQFLSLSRENSLVVFVRKSPEQRVLEEDGVSLCEVEERAMIMKMRRIGAGLWNS